MRELSLFQIYPLKIVISLSTFPSLSIYPSPSPFPSFFLFLFFILFLLNDLFFWVFPSTSLEIFLFFFCPSCPFSFYLFLLECEKLPRSLIWVFFLWLYLLTVTFIYLCLFLCPFAYLSACLQLSLLAVFLHQL